MQGYIRRKVTRNLGRGFNSIESPSLFGDTGPPNVLLERFEIVDEVGCYPCEKEYAEMGMEEGWLKYQNHYRDRYGVCHRYRLVE